jgi:CheY-like chemotaxis protein
MPEPAAPREESAGSPVLVVDDDPSARDLLTRHLTSEGFPVLTAATGPEALELLKQHRPVAVLLDVMMPGMDGWHVLKAIRSNPETEKIPVIMQTVLDDTRVAYALGANSYLKKPIRRAELAEALLSAVQAQGERRVLVVDDDAEASRRLKVLLQRDGWSVDLAEEGGQALDLLRANSYALVLADLVMPGMDGHALVRAIRRAPEFDGIPIVVMTAQDINSAAVRKLKSKTAGIVQKGSMPLFDLVADLRGITDAAAAAQSQSQGAE